MTLTDIIIIAIVLVIVVAIALYLRREKKRGATCIGCPHAKQCGGKCSGHVHDRIGKN